MAYQLITNSGRNTFNACRRMYYYSYEMRRRRLRSSDALYFGSLWHGALHQYYAAAPEAKTPKELANRLSSAEKWLNEQTVTEWNERHLLICKILLETYHSYYAKDPLLVVAAEQPYTSYLLNPDTGAASRTWLLAGMIDLVVKSQRIKNQTALGEHKSTSSDIGVDSEYWMNLTMDGQISGYYVGLTALGLDCTHCLYNVVQRPTQTPNQIPNLDARGQKIVVDHLGRRIMKKDGKPRLSGDKEKGWSLQTRPETDVEYTERLRGLLTDPNKIWFRRRIIPRTEEDLAEYLFDMWVTTRNIRECQLAQARREGKNQNPLVAWPRNPSSCTFFFGGRCPFFDVCAHVAEITDDTMYSTGKKHPELIIPDLVEPGSEWDPKNLKQLTQS